MIRIQQVEKSFKLQQQLVPIIRIADWSVPQGERMALLGPSGSGKSTLLHLVGGVLPSDQGQLEVGGQIVSAMSESERDRFRAEMIGYVFQDFHLISSLTAVQNVELVCSGSMAKTDRKKLLSKWFERVGLADRMHQLPSQLSRGQQQRVAIIRALINRPRLILADEPTGSLDWESAASVMQLLLDMCAENGSTLLTVTHDLHLAKLYPVSVQMESINEILQRPRTVISAASGAGGTAS